jgi:hypothetical protein
MHQMCITMATAQETLLSNAQTSTIQLGSLMTPAALSSQIGNVLRTSLQLLGLAWAQLVYTSNSVASLSAVGAFPLGRTFSSINLTQETALSLAKALNTSLRFHFLWNDFTIDDALSASVGSMFVPLANPTFFRPVNFSALAPDLYALNYEAYFTSCSPLKCDVTRLQTWRERLFSALVSIGGFGTAVYTIVLYSTEVVLRKSLRKVGVDKPV